jgi:hypothetical protein
MSDEGNESYEAEAQSSSSQSQPWDQDDWVPANAASAMKLEADLHPEETDEQCVRRMFKEASPVAAAGIIHLALHGSSERIRFDAQKHIVERVIGKVGEEDSGVESPVDALMKEVTDFVNSQPKGEGN